MKYNLLTTIYLLILLTLTEFIGLYIVLNYAYIGLPYNIKPSSVSEGFNVFYFITSIIIMTMIFYLFTRLKYEKFLRLWFSIAIFFSLSIALNAFVSDVSALIIAGVLTILRIFNTDYYVHNLTEVFIYGGIVSLFVDLFTPLSAFILLLIISVYDYISVFITKHMIYLAKNQESANVFTGLVIYNNADTAILGGGDIAFSLLFASVLGINYGVVFSYITIYLVLGAILSLTILGKKGRFYPAMPLITVACGISFLLALYSFYL